MIAALQDSYVEDVFHGVAVAILELFRPILDRWIGREER